MSHRAIRAARLGLGLRLRLRLRVRREPHANIRLAARLGAVFAVALAVAALVGCGQRGPLTLPDSARPIERLDPAGQLPAAGAQPADTPPVSTSPAATGAPSGSTPPAQREPGTQDEASQNKARQPENER